MLEDEWLPSFQTLHFFFETMFSYNMVIINYSALIGPLETASLPAPLSQRHPKAGPM